MSKGGLKKTTKKEKEKNLPGEKEAAYLFHSIKLSLDVVDGIECFRIRHRATLTSLQGIT